jgi:hypothetical protein
VNKSPDAIRPHGPAAKTLHWGFIAVFLYALSKQLDDLEELADRALLQYEMVFASAFLVLLVARFWYMRTRNASALPGRSTKTHTNRLSNRSLGYVFLLSNDPADRLGHWGAVLEWHPIRRLDGRFVTDPRNFCQHGAFPYLRAHCGGVLSPKMP